MIQRSSNVILFATHVWNDKVAEKYDKLRTDSNDHDIILLYQQDRISSSIIDASIAKYAFDRNCLTELGYTAIINDLVPGSNHFPVLQFYRDNPQYEYYWNIEYDVYFNGSWAYFFQLFENNKSDFITSHIQDYDSQTYWHWWNSLQLVTMQLPITQALRSFNPIYRISNRALKALDQFLLAGNKGHHEVLIPTFLHHSGYTIQDFGANEQFGTESHEPLVTKDETNSLDYPTGSMRYRPVIAPNEITIPNILYHPCK